VWRRKPEAQRRRRPGRSRDLGGDEIRVRVRGAERRGAGGEEAEVGGGGMEALCDVVGGSAWPRGGGRGEERAKRWGRSFRGRSTESIRVCLVHSRTESLYFCVCFMSK
jgi:hypothetical protein